MICQYRSLSADSSRVDSIVLIGRYQTLGNGKDNSRILTVHDAPLEGDAFRYIGTYERDIYSLSSDKESLARIGGGPGGRAGEGMNVITHPPYENFKKGHYESA